MCKWYIVLADWLWVLCDEPKQALYRLREGHKVRLASDDELPVMVLSYNTIDWTYYW